MTKEQWSAHVRMMLELMTATLENRSCDCNFSHDREVGKRREAADSLRSILDEELHPEWLTDWSSL